MKYIAFLGRVFYSLIFLLSGPRHFLQSSIDYGASQNVPFPDLLVPVSGVIAVLGALSIVVGYKAKLGAWLLIIFLVPVTLYMHQFWVIDDPMMYRVQMAMFMKNTSMLGAALFIAYTGAGPVSMDQAKITSM